MGSIGSELGNLMVQVDELAANVDDNDEFGVPRGDDGIAQHNDADHDDAVDGDEGGEEDMGDHGIRSSFSNMSMSPPRVEARRGAEGGTDADAAAPLVGMPLAAPQSTINASRVAPFISKLYEMASKHPEAVSWGAGGESVVVIDAKVKLL